jgi:hypothetical protein
MVAMKVAYCDVCRGKSPAESIEIRIQGPNSNATYFRRVMDLCNECLKRLDVALRQSTQQRTEVRISEEYYDIPQPS